jgi:hypothetical protein
MTRSREPRAGFLDGRWRRGLALGFALGLAVGVLFGAVALGDHLPGTERLQPYRRVGSVDYSAEPFRGLAPLARAFIAQILGEGQAPHALDAGGSPSRTPRVGTRVLGRKSVQVPAGQNDNFASAQEVPSVPFTARTNTRSATLEPGEPQTCQPSTGTVWYRYTPRADIGVSASTIGSAFSTVMAVYSGTSFGNLVSLACKDAPTYGPSYKVSFRALKGRIYFFQIGGVGTASGDLIFNLDPTPRPPNDNFSNATVLSKLPATDHTNTAGASLEPGEPQPSCQSSVGATVWYRYTPPVDMPLAVTMFGSDFPTVVGIYTGNHLNALHEVACDSSLGIAYQSRSVFRARAGKTYSIGVGGAFGDRGELSFGLARAPLRPVNDDFAKAALAVPAYSDRPNTFGATLQASEPSPTCAPSIAGSLWYRFTPAETMQVVADTFDSRMDTVLAVYTGHDLATLRETPLACSDDSPVATGAGGTQINSQVSRLTFTALAGTTYFFQLSIKSGAGNLAFNLTRANS